MSRLSLKLPATVADLLHQLEAAAVTVLADAKVAVVAAVDSVGMMCSAADGDQKGTMGAGAIDHVGFCSVDAR